MAIHHLIKSLALFSPHTMIMSKWAMDSYERAQIFLTRILLNIVFCSTLHSTTILITVYDTLITRTSPNYTGGCLHRSNSACNF